MTAAAGLILAEGAGQIGAVFWAALAAAVLAIAAGVLALLLFRGIARHRARRGEDLPDLPRGGPELHEDVAEVIRGWAAEWDRQKGERR